MANKITFEIIAKALGFKNTDQAVKGLSGRMKKFATGLAATGVAYKAIGATIEGVKLFLKNALYINFILFTSFILINRFLYSFLHFQSF